MKKTLNQLSPSLIARDWDSLNDKLRAIFGVIDENFDEQAEITEGLDSALALSLNNLEQRLKQLNDVVLQQNTAQAGLNKELLLMSANARIELKALGERLKPSISAVPGAPCLCKLVPDTAHDTTHKDEDGIPLAQPVFAREASFGDRLKKARIDMELSASDMATSLGITRHYYTKLESGESPMMVSKEMAALANMGFDINYLLTGNRHVSA